MRFLSVADRELRSAARRKATYHARWITAVVFLGLLIWLLWVSHGFVNRRVAPQIFKVFSVLTFLYCLFLSTARTADCISVERREGTLGLLFLTNLNSAEIIAGKLCSNALASVYGLMAIFPMLSLPLLMGGIAFADVARTMVGLLNGILLALACGFLASVLCKRQFTALALSMGMTISLAGGLMLAAAAADSYGPTKPLANWLLVASPLYTVIAADGTRIFGPNRFWGSVTAVVGMSIGALTLTTLVLACNWRDRPKRPRVWQRLRLGRRSGRDSSETRAAVRRRMLAINPLFWLAGRQPVSSPVIMVIAVALTLFTVYIAAPFFGRVMRAGTATPVLGHLFAWLWAGLAIHALVLYYAATAASQPLAEDKQAGALELILSTPTTERTISRGLWMAYARKMLFPALLAVLIHIFFLWVCMVMATLDPPGRLTIPGATPGTIFWAAVLDKPIGGQALDWQFGFMLRIVLLILLQLMVTWLALGWVGRWLGLRMKQPGFAPLASIALLYVPPVLLFSLVCYLADKYHFGRLPERQFLSLMMWIAVAIGMGHHVLLSRWAASHLRRHLRATALSRYEPLPAWRWRLPSKSAVRRFAATAATAAAVVTALVLGYYGLQNWRGERAWKAFQAARKQRHESIEVSSLLPPLVPDGANFARSPAFVGLLSRTNREAASLFERMGPFELQVWAFRPNPVLLDWYRQSRSPLTPFLNWTKPPAESGPDTDRQEIAAALLKKLEPHHKLLQDVAAATQLPAFQTTACRDATAVLRPAREQLLLLERLHLLFQIRASALLATGRNSEAAEEVLIGLRLAQLARQSPDIGSTLRVQGLLVRSLQPLWEGLKQEAWAEPELAAIQRELAGFRLLSDYTNAVRRVVLAHINIWCAIPYGTNLLNTLQAPGAQAPLKIAQDMQPRAWWFESSLQLYDAGQSLLRQVDVASGRVQQSIDWASLNGLPLENPSRELLYQSLGLGPLPTAVPFTQTSLNQAIVACALERFHLTNRAYPATLERLVPALLDRVPHDAVSGRPLLYETDGTDRFILRGVGPNGADDRKNKSSDDWLWAYSTNRLSATPLR